MIQTIWRKSRTLTRWLGSGLEKVNELGEPGGWLVREASTQARRMLKGKGWHARGPEDFRGPGRSGRGARHHHCRASVSVQELRGQAGREDCVWPWCPRGERKQVPILREKQGWRVCNWWLRTESPAFLLGVGSHGSAVWWGLGGRGGGEERGSTHCSWCPIW